MKALQSNYGYLSFFLFSLLSIQNTQRAHKTLNNESMDFSMLKTSISKLNPKKFSLSFDKHPPSFNWNFLISLHLVQRKI